MRPQMKSRRFRYILLAVMTVLVGCCVALLPRININGDMTRYLPDDSRMKQGVDTLKAYFPEIDMNALYVKAMFPEVDDSDSLSNELAARDGVSGIVSVKEKDGLTLYQLSVEKGADAGEIASRIVSEYGDSVIVEHNANSIMPDNMVLILIVGVAIVFGILFLMCSSLVEALLFIVTIGMAVLLNMGTNALLPSVSMMTNTIVAVLQLVLSMDYSIILMNRFRQVLRDEPDIDKAMTRSIREASPSILSSGLTTIVGLLALLFMKFKIGMDLGIVLAKGVFFSLLSIYTILPALILICFKGIRRTEKKVFLLPTDRLANFELRFRTPLAVIFVLTFGMSWYLAGRTELSYASIWESRINETFPPENAFSLLYRTSSEDRIPDLIDSLSSDPEVIMALSYPTLFNKEMTASRMYSHISSLASLMPVLGGTDITVPDIDPRLLSEDNIRFIYYAATHPLRDERMSFEDMIALADDASGSGLLPEGLDVGALAEQFLTPESGVETDVPEPEVPELEVKAGDPTPGIRDDAELQTEEPGNGDIGPVPGESRTSLAEIAKPDKDESGDDPYGLRGKYNFTREGLNTPMTSTGIAEYLGFSRSQASAAFAMAKKRNGKMTPDEFIDYMIGNVLGNKMLRRLISDKQAEGLHYIRQEMDAVLSSPDAGLTATAMMPDTAVYRVARAEEIPAVKEDSLGTVLPLGTTEMEPNPVLMPEMTPMERLAEMYASGRKYSSVQIYRALHRAGIDVADQGMVNLMFAYYGSKYNFDPDTRMSLNGIVDYLSEVMAVSDDYASILDDDTRALLIGLRLMVDDGMEMLRKDGWSMAAIVTTYPLESSRTFEFVDKTVSLCDARLGRADNCLIGESVMYKEMKDGFRRELLLLTLLTIFSIFLIVALTFKSALIPTILVMTVMTGVNVNVFFSGVGGHTMLYLAYLIVQSILMGATIDYGILYTNYYLGYRRDGQPRADALKNAYRGSIHTIMTSGLIIILAPFIMAELLTDPTICSILSSLTFGALSAIMLIILVLPAMLAALDRFIVRKH